MSEEEKIFNLVSSLQVLVETYQKHVGIPGVNNSYQVNMALEETMRVAANMITKRLEGASNE